MLECKIGCLGPRKKWKVTVALSRCRFLKKYYLQQLFSRKIHYNVFSDIYLNCRTHLLQIKIQFCQFWYRKNLNKKFTFVSWKWGLFFLKKGNPIFSIKLGQRLPKSFSQFHGKNLRCFLSYFLKKDDWTKAYAGPRLLTLPYLISGDYVRDFNDFKNLWFHPLHTVLGDSVNFIWFESFSYDFNAISCGFKPSSWRFKIEDWSLYWLDFMWFLIISYFLWMHSWFRTKLFHNFTSEWHLDSYI